MTVRQATEPPECCQPEFSCPALSDPVFGDPLLSRPLFSHPPLCASRKLSRVNTGWTVKPKGSETAGAKKDSIIKLRVGI
jgi:hypothetical protein